MKRHVLSYPVLRSNFKTILLPGPSFIRSHKVAPRILFLSQYFSLFESQGIEGRAENVNVTFLCSIKWSCNRLCNSSWCPRSSRRRSTSVMSLSPFAIFVDFFMRFHKPQSVCFNTVNFFGKTFIIRGSTVLSYLISAHLSWFFLVKLYLN